MQVSTPPPDPVAEAADLVALRRRTIAALQAIIVAPDAQAAVPDGEVARPRSPVHDPALRRRTEAIERLGRFPDPEAAAVLTALVLHGERDFAAPTGRWLRDSALLVLLRSRRLPPAAVDQALGRTYSFVRHPWPWQWSTVYDDLPLLGRYRRTGTFVRVFWVWPLLILAVPTLALVWQLLFPAPVGDVGGGFGLTTLRDTAITVGTGLEIYLVHQILIAVLAGRYGPPVQLPGGASAHRKAWIGAGLALLVGGLVAVIILLIVSGSFTIVRNGESAGGLGLGLAVFILPLLLLPLYIVAHDLEQAVRYAPRRSGWGVRAIAVVLRRLTDVTYILALPALAGLVWGMGGSFRAAALVWLVYLFIVPLIVDGALIGMTKGVARMRARRRAARAPDLAPSESP